MDFKSKGWGFKSLLAYQTFFIILGGIIILSNIFKSADSIFVVMIFNTYHFDSYFLSMVKMQ